MLRRLPLICAILIGCFTILFIQLQYILDVLHTPAGTHFLGTVHNASDYFSYLSYMAEGRDHWLTMTDLYTEEAVPRNLIRWQFVLSGRIFYLLGIHVIVGYQIMVFVSLVFFLITGFILIRLLIPHRPWQQVLAFLFFATSTSWPIVSYSDKGVSLGYHTYWYNTGNVLGRFGPTPHHLLGGGLFLLSFFFAIRWIQDRGHWWYLVILAILSCLLVTINPIPWLLLIATTGMGSLVAHVVQKKGWKILKLLNSVACQLAMLGGGVPAALYLQYTYAVPPWSNGSGWEMWQQIYIHPLEMMYSSGIVTVFALIGMIPMLRKIKIEYFISLFIIIMCFVCFYLRISFYLKVTNVRFLPPGLYLFVGIVASEGVVFLGQIYKPLTRWIIGILLVVYLSSSALSHYAQQRDLSLVDANNVLMYATDDMWNAYRYVDEQLPKDGVYLVQWPFTLQFPALTGRKSFFGGSDMTINGPAKTAVMDKFFAGTLTEAEVKEFFRVHPITYLFVYSDNSAIEKWPFFKRIYKTHQISIYKVEM